MNVPVVTLSVRWCHRRNASPVKAELYRPKFSMNGLLREGFSMQLECEALTLSVY